MPTLRTEEAQNTTPPPRRLWPDAVAFREAVQNPHVLSHLGFDTNASLCLDRQGLPLAYTGRFAIVFRIRDGNGSDWALRCFTSENGEPARANARYEALAQYLETVTDDARTAFVPFQFEPNGVAVGREAYPALVMRWAGGIPLGRWIDAHLNDSSALLHACAALGDLLETLEAAHIAHGDWQHDNLLVSDDGKRITLVDYDGVWVPALGVPPTEQGHPNYQRPARTTEDWGPGLDRFSCLLIQTALYGVACEPTLWNASDGESCLFTRTDLVAPQESPLFSRMYRIAENRPLLAQALDTLQSACFAMAAPVAIAEIRYLGMDAREWVETQTELAHPGHLIHNTVRASSQDALSKWGKERTNQKSEIVEERNSSSLSRTTWKYIHRVALFVLAGYGAYLFSQNRFSSMVICLWITLIMGGGYFAWPRHLRYGKIFGMRHKSHERLRACKTELKIAQSRLYAINSDPAASSLIAFVEASLHRAKISDVAPHIWNDNACQAILNARSIHSVNDLHPMGGGILYKLQPVGGEAPGNWEAILNELLAVRQEHIQVARTEWDMLTEKRCALRVEVTQLVAEEAGLMREYIELSRKLRKVGDVSFLRFLAYLIGC